MNDMNDITLPLRDWIREPVSLREDGVDRVAQLVHDTPQQRGWLPPLPADRLGRVLAFAGGAATGVVAAVLGGLLLLALVAGAGEQRTPGAASPSPSPPAEPTGAPPDWPGVAFVPDDDVCVDGCDWASGGVWEVKADHHGDFGSAQAIAFGPSGAPWFLSDDTVWRLGVPGSSTLPAALAGGGPGPGLVVADDGTVWLASELGLHSFDGETWTEHWSGAGLVDVDVRPDGSVVAVGGGRVRTVVASEASPVVVVRLDKDGVEAEPLAALPELVWPVGIVATSEDELWVGAVESGYVPVMEGESLIAHFDGEDWEAVRPLGPDVDVAAWTLAGEPDGSLWASLEAVSEDGGFESYLARHDGQGWALGPIGDPPRQTAGLGLRVGPDGTVWLTDFDMSEGVSSGIAAFDGQARTRYLEGEHVGPLAIAPDGTVFATTVPGFDEDGGLFAIRPQR